MVYVIAVVACLICFIIYLIEKNNVKLKQKHNTRELNKLVEQVKEEIQEEEKPVLYEEPVLEKIDVVPETKSVSEMIEKPTEQKSIEKGEGKTNTVVSNEPIREEVIVEPLIMEPYDIPTLSIEDNNKTEENNKVAQKVEPTPIIEEEEELQYTSIEPDQATAQLELKLLTEELRKQEELEKLSIEEENNNIALTSYEEEQEENAIISLEELVKKSKEMYKANELTQYADEGNEPISLQELENKSGNKAANYEEPFIIENVVPEEEKVEVIEEAVQERPKVVMDDFKSVKAETTSVFKSSPIISPIYGIEKQETSSNGLELENTANYEKLDAEIKKTNEFLMTLKELQKKLD